MVILLFINEHCRKTNQGKKGKLKTKNETKKKAKKNPKNKTKQKNQPKLNEK